MNLRVIYFEVWQFVACAQNLLWDFCWFSNVPVLPALLPMFKTVFMSFSIISGRFLPYPCRSYAIPRRFYAVPRYSLPSQCRSPSFPAIHMTFPVIPRRSHAAPHHSSPFPSRSPSFPVVPRHSPF